MKIKSLKLKDYRNCKDIELNLDSEKVLIIGKNAQGKTNILESIFFLSTLKSQRTSNNTELINFNANSVAINAVVEKADTEIELDFSYTQDKKRELKANGLKTRPKEFKSAMKTVLFSTADLLLLRGTPSDRRNWLDTAISQVYPAYEERLSKYNKIRTQKNNFLKEYDGNETLLEVYNEQSAILGSNIIYLRLKFLKEMERLAGEKHSTISQDEKLSIKYDCHFLPEEKENLTVEEILQKFRERLVERKELEIIRGQSLVGPHRDDIIFFINKAEATKFASQGQQRTVVLSLKLAELDIITEKFGESPV
ncbi:DNA replication/repair protein RecF, partial [bacterium]|nr:DNA replication/repair protein RecF [bacterium]